METRTGRAAAALWSASIGLLALAATQLVAEISADAGKAIHNLGKIWIPGAEGIGPYSGKETIALIVWFGSWGILRQLLKDRDPSPGAVGIGLLITIGVATTLLWPPMWGIIVPLFGGEH